MYTVPIKIIVVFCQWHHGITGNGEGGCCLDNPPTNLWPGSAPLGVLCPGLHSPGSKSEARLARATVLALCSYRRSLYVCRSASDTDPVSNLSQDTLIDMGSQSLLQGLGCVLY